MVRKLLVGAALGCVGVLVPACSSSSAPAAAPSPSPASTSATSAPSAAPATSATTAASSAPAGPGPCPTRALGVKVGLSQGTAGTTYTVLDFTNISTVTCTLYGYPGVALAGGTPVTQIGLAATESTTTPRRLVTLTPGAVANALLQIANADNYPASSCDPVTATYLQIYPPNQTTPVYLAYTTRTCAKPVRTLHVSVVQAGSGGSS